jgi:hypothetical protein
VWAPSILDIGQVISNVKHVNEQTWHAYYESAYFICAYYTKKMYSYSSVSYTKQLKFRTHYHCVSSISAVFHPRRMSAQEFTFPFKLLRTGHVLPLTLPLPYRHHDDGCSMRMTYNRKVLFWDHITRCHCTLSYSTCCRAVRCHVTYGNDLNSRYVTTSLFPTSQPGNVSAILGSDFSLLVMWAVMAQSV